MTFDEWASQHLPAVLRFATALCGGRHLAEDVVQEVLLKAHIRWERIEAADNPDAYIRRMVVNEFLSWRRKWARVIPRADVEVPTWVPGAAVDHATNHADRDELLAELGKLPRRQRAVLVLRYYGGQSDHEIATTLGCSPSTVRAHASRALATLRVEYHAASRTPERADTGASHAF